MKSSSFFRQDTYLQTKYTSLDVDQSILITVLTKENGVLSFSTFEDVIDSTSIFEVFTIHPLPGDELISVSYRSSGDAISIGQCFIQAAITFSVSTDPEAMLTFGSGYLSSAQPLTIIRNSSNVPQLTKPWVRVVNLSPAVGDDILFTPIAVGLHKVITFHTNFVTTVAGASRNPQLAIRDSSVNNVFLRVSNLMLAANKTHNLAGSLNINDELVGIIRASIKLPNAFIPHLGSFIIGMLNKEALDAFTNVFFEVETDMGQI